MLLLRVPRRCFSILFEAKINVKQYTGLFILNDVNIYLEGNHDKKKPSNTYTHLSQIRVLVGLDHIYFLVFYYSRLLFQLVSTYKLTGGKFSLSTSVYCISNSHNVF